MIPQDSHYSKFKIWYWFSSQLIESFTEAQSKKTYPEFQTGATSPPVETVGALDHQASAEVKDKIEATLSFFSLTNINC